jgi:ParB/RepB/Spo0J family partition protein
VKEKGILQAPVGTRVRDRKTGKEGVLIVAGRRRRAAAEKNKIPEIEVKLTSCRNLQEYLLLAGTENIVRENMSYWDTACYFSKLLATGMKQTDIAAHFGEKTDGFVSQHLAVFKLDERVRKYVRDATQEPFKSTSATVVRELKRLSDGDIQTKFAMEAIENSWSPKILKAKVEVWLAKHNAEPTPGKGKKGAKRTIKLPEVVESKDVQIVPKALLVSGYNYQAQRIAKLSSSDKTKDTTLAYEKGLLEGLGYVSGLQKPPQQWKDYTPPVAE